ncbi:ATP-binding protein [Nocardioides sp. URHA0020]|uniref:ATP-binding protein n=1 Tax=Nocardioides sp. URHA0020 TaxID=1380392 RepID=UPI0006858E2B|nr:ATP-binding protein [Nocardioides sp. URHA0020]
MIRVRLLDLGAFAAYFTLAAYLGRQALVDGSSLALVWPAAGVAAAWLAVTGWQRWIVVDALAVFLLTWAVYVATGSSTSVGLTLAVAMVVQVLVFGVLISRWCPGWWGFGAEPPAGVQRLRDLGLLLAAALGSAVVSALVGPGLLVVAVTDTDWSALASWVVRNSVGVIAIFPLSLLARNAARAHTPGRSPAPFGPYRGSTLEAVALVVTTGVAGWLIFWVNDGLPIPFLLLATSVWAGTRFSPWVADVHALLLVAGVVCCTVLERGPFAQISSPTSQVLAVQAYVAVAVVLTLALSVGRRESLALVQRLGRSERAAVEQAATMRTILDAMADGVSVVDAAGHIVLRNPAAAVLMGEIQVDAEGTLDVGGYDLRYADGTSVTAEVSPIARAFAGEAIEHVDLFVRNPEAPDGRIVEVTARPIPGSDPPLVVAVFHDVSADRRERDELASFAGVVAHDLLNPLTVVEGWSEALLESARAGIVVPPAVQADQLDRVHRAAQRMQHLISDLLAYTTARDLRITPVRVDLLALARDIARARVEAGRVSDAPIPVITVDPALPDVLAEPVLLRQVIDNLVGNAVKYVAPGVCPEIAVSGRTVAGDDGPMVLIEVVDNGIGIPSGQHARVFDTFHRAHAEGYRGSGLGLSIVKRIVERHGGTASARDNADSHGTTMSVSFPAA